MMDELERLIKSIPGAEIEDVELVGSGAVQILDSDPDYQFSVQLLLLPSEKPLDIKHDPAAPNDFDIRIKLKGCTVDNRKWLSQRMVEFYSRLAKEQSTELLAYKVARIVHERERFGLIDQMKSLVLAVLQGRMVPGLDPRGKKELQLLISNTPLLNSSGEEDTALRIAETYVRSRDTQFIRAHALRIAKHFKVPCEFNAKQARVIENISRWVIRQDIFQKLCHVDNEQAGNSFSIHSFAGLETLLAMKINSHLLTVDSNKISFKNHKVKGGVQGILDRLMRVVRIDRHLLTALHFMKLQSYKIQGFDPASDHPERVLAKVIEWAMGDSAWFDKFWNGYAENHLRGNPLKMACFLLSCCLAIRRHCPEQFLDQFLDHFKDRKDLQSSKGWVGVLYKMIFSKNVPLEDSEILIQGLAALYLRKKIASRDELHVAMREDVTPSYFKLSIKTPNSKLIA